MAVVFTGRIVEFITEKPSYDTGEQVRVKIHYQAERSGLGLWAWVFWRATTRVFVDGILTDDTEAHFEIAPWTKYDVEEDTTRWLNLGRMPSHDMLVTWDIWCGDTG